MLPAETLGHLPPCLRRRDRDILSLARPSEPETHVTNEDDTVNKSDVIRHDRLLLAQCVWYSLEESEKLLREVQRDALQIKKVGRHNNADRLRQWCIYARLPLLEEGVPASKDLVLGFVVYTLAR